MTFGVYVKKKRHDSTKKKECKRAFSLSFSFCHISVVSMLLFLHVTQRLRLTGQLSTWTVRLTVVSCIHDSCCYPRIRAELTHTQTNKHCILFSPTWMRRGDRPTQHRTWKRSGVGGDTPNISNKWRINLTVLFDLRRQSFVVVNVNVPRSMNQPANQTINESIEQTINQLAAS